MTLVHDNDRREVPTKHLVIGWDEVLCDARRFRDEKPC
jgi:hypothetical protein